MTINSEHKLVTITLNDIRNYSHASDSFGDWEFAQVKAAFLSLDLADDYEISVARIADLYQQFGMLYRLVVPYKGIGIQSLINQAETLQIDGGEDKEEDDE